MLRTGRLRADTTVVEANVAYPTDSGLLAKGVAAMAPTGEAAAGPGPGHPHQAGRPDPQRAGPGARSIGANLRRRSDDRLAEVQRLNGELAGIAERTARQADAVARNARRGLRRQVGRTRRAGESAGRPAGTHGAAGSSGRGTDPPAPGRADPGRGDPARVPSRPRRPAHRQGPPRPPRRVRLQGATRRQRRRRHRRPQRRGRQPARRADARPRRRTDHRPHRAGPAGGHRRPGLRRSRRRGPTPRRRCPLRRPSPQGPTHRGPPPDRETTGVPQDGPLENRLRRPDQLRETGLRAQPHPTRRPRRRPNLVRPRQSSPTT